MNDILNDKFVELYEAWSKGKVDNHKAVRKFVRLADQGVTKAQTLVASAYACGGWEFELSTELAIKYAKMAEHSGDALNYLTLAFIYDPNNTSYCKDRVKYINTVEAYHYYKKSFLAFKKGAKNGDPDAMSGLADCFSSGWGTEVDPEAARYWQDQTYLCKTGKTFLEYQKIRGNDIQFTKK